MSLCKKQVYCIVLFTVNSSCPSVSSSIWKKKKINHKVYRCRGRVVKGSSTLFTLPRLSHAAKTQFCPHHPPATTSGQGLHLLLTSASENKNLLQCPGFQKCKKITLDRMYQLVSCIRMLSAPALVLHWPACNHGQHPALLRGALGTPRQKALPYN